MARFVYVVRAVDERGGLHTWVYGERDGAERKRDRWRKQNPKWKTVQVRKRAIR